MAIAWLTMPPISCAHEEKRVPGLVHWEDADSTVKYRSCMRGNQNGSPDPIAENRIDCNVGSLA